MAGNEKLRSVCRDVVNGYTNTKNALEYGRAQKLSGRKIFALELQDKAANEKLSVTFKKLAALIPEEKKLEAHAKIEELWKSTFSGEAAYKRRKEQILQTPDAFPTQKEKDIFLLHKPMMGFVHENGDKVFDIVVEALDGLELDEVIDEIENYSSADITNIKVYPFADVVENLKKKNAQTIEDKEKLNELNAELDIIAKGVITSDMKYCQNQDDLEVSASHDINVQTDEINDRQFESKQYGELKSYFKVSPKGFYYGSRDLTDERFYDTNVANEFLKPDRKFVLPDDKKKALLNVLNLMKERGILEFGKLGIGESNRKEYSFMQISFAHKKLEKLLQSGSTDVEALRNAREEYETTLQNMRDVYKMIETEIGPDENMSIGNLSSYRTEEVPNEFKNNIFVNSFANAIYNIGIMSEKCGVSFEELVEDPSNTLFKFFDEVSKDLTPDKYLSQYTLKGAIGSIYFPATVSGYPYLSVGRHAEFLRQLTFGSDVYEQNTLAMMLTTSYDMRVQSLVESNNKSAPAGFLRSGDRAQTVANILLVNDEDRDYGKLRSFEAISVTGKEKIPPFNAIEYFETHKVSPTEMIGRITGVLQDIANEKEPRPEPFERETFILRAAQVAAYEFMMVHPAPDADREDSFYSKEEYDALKLIVSNPMKAFSKFMVPGLKADLSSSGLKAEMSKIPSFSSYIKEVERTGKNAIKEARREAREAERAYNKNASELEKKIESLENSSGSKEEIAVAKAELAAVREAEIKRLEKAYTEGKLPKDYFEQRRADVDLGRQEKNVPFGVSERPNFSRFKKENANALEGMSEEEIKYAYNSMMENARRAENTFMLVAAEKQPKPTLESEEPIIREVKDETPSRENINVYDDVKEKNDEFSKPIGIEAPTSVMTVNK